MTVSDPAAIRAVTDELCSIRWKAAGGAGSADKLWRLQWIGADGKLLEELSVLDDRTIVCGRRRWTAAEGSLNLRRLEALFGSMQ